MRSASYASAVYQPRRDADPYGALRFDGKKKFESFSQDRPKLNRTNPTVQAVKFAIENDVTSTIPYYFSINKGKESNRCGRVATDCKARFHNIQVKTTTSQARP
ncbi:jg19079 [Pararge aegeria aegeria]|uniref:Jg19079 protein n=1 Tax=Pararge aegeria aegeria TaxID=348720 RepID=A0A8S4SJQ0_9NEOP|nr:jg19079 [Pararge aegeria aegeria]